MTDRERIIAFLTEHPEWVDAYRTTSHGVHTCLVWLDTAPAIKWLSFYNNGDPKGDDYTFYLPPEGEWRPLPEPETFEQ